MFSLIRKEERAFNVFDVKIKIYKFREPNKTMEFCDKCGKEIKDKWKGKRVFGDRILCEECSDKEIFDGEK